MAATAANTTLTVRGATGSITNGTSGNVTASCAVGEKPVGGGCDWNGEVSTTNLAVLGNRPTVTSGAVTTASGWYCEGRNARPSGADVLRAFAICLA